MARRLGVALLAAAVGIVAFLAWPSRESPGERYRRGLAALEANDLDAVAAAAESLRGDPEFDSHRHLLQAGHALRSGDPRKAISELTLVGAADDLNEPAALLRGEALYRVGRLTDAERVLLRLDGARPDHPEVCRWLAAIYYDLGAMHHASGRLEQLAKLAPDDFAPHRMLGMINSDFETFAAAIGHYQEALKRSPPEPVRREVARELALAMIHERRYADALEVLRDSPANADVLALRCESHWNLDRPEEARRCRDEALALDPGNRAALLVGARLHLDDGEPDRAVPLLNRALEDDPHDPETRYQLAMAFRRLGREQDSERELARKEASQELRDRLARLNLQAMDEPRDAGIRDELADVCRRLGKDDLAEMWRKAADACREHHRLAGAGGVPPARRSGTPVARGHDAARSDGAPNE